MTKKEQYNIEFKKIYTPGFNMTTYTARDLRSGYGPIGSVLDSFNSIFEIDLFIYEIEQAQNGLPFEDDFQRGGLFFS